MGRKSNLIKRCAALIQKDGLSIEQKIREVYERRHIGEKGVPRPIVKINRPKSIGTKLPVRDDVKFTPLAFYDFIAEVLKPTVLYSDEDLRNSSMIGAGYRTTPGNHQTNVQFYLSPQEAEDVAVSRFWSTENNQWQYAINIQLRICKFTDGVQMIDMEDNLPPNLYILVNNRIISLPMPKPTSRPNAEVLRPGRPIDITEYCRLSPTLYNLVELGWSTGLSNDSPLTTYCTTVVLVRKLSVKTLIQRLRFEFPKNTNTDESKMIIREKLGITNASNDTSSEGLLQITSNTLHASLLCPISKCRITIPARTKSCRHIQCFDLEVFLLMNEKRPTWTCPVCDLKAPYHNLLIDWFFENVLCSCKESDAVEFDKNCNFTEAKIENKTLKKKIDLLNTNSVKEHRSNLADDDDALVILSDDESSSPSSCKKEKNTKDINLIRAPTESHESFGWTMSSMVLANNNQHQPSAKNIQRFGFDDVITID
ncbi:hypothetical protein GJ496_000234 [Pomphorhynchus laevis]|nr:hypothetical protein GJ496_000234 [Pomphorhynchus laevis]